MDARRLTVFSDDKRLTAGGEAEVVAALRTFLAAHPTAQARVFDDATGRAVDLDLTSPPPRSRAAPGRPKLGVVAREVTLLPRHWEWLTGQPGGASAALRRLVEEARKAGGDDARRAKEAAYHFMVDLAGDRRGYEEATRALFAGNRARFDALIEEWPADVRDHARRLAAPAFPQQAG